MKIEGKDSSRWTESQYVIRGRFSPLPLRVAQGGKAGDAKPSRTRSIALASLLGALYAVGVTFLASISFAMVQVRVADMLLPLSIIFGPPAIVGLTLGNLVANVVGPYGLPDVVGGTAANFLATLAAYAIGRRSFRGAWILATIAETLIITFLVGSYLSFVTGEPLYVWWLGVFSGSFVAINILGYALVKGVHRAMP